MLSKSKLVYLSPASEDIEEIVKYTIQEAGLSSARSVYNSIKTEIQRLEDFPLLGRLHPDPLLASENFRKLLLTKTYVAVYKVIDGTVVIYRVVNAKTDYPKLLK